MEELEDILSLGVQEAKRINKTPYAFLYSVEYDGDIGSPSEYREDFTIYRNATPNDVIKMHINSGGGRLDTLIQLINNIRGTEATTVGYLEGNAYSAAGALFLQADQHVIAPNSSLMIHESTYGVLDSSAKLNKQVDFSRKHLRKCYLDYYHNFLTLEEIDKVLDGHDMWMDAEEIVERLEKRNKLNSLEESDSEELKENNS
ncbi:MAG: putative capsid assembly protease C [Prokaryotic dsDNA virus sp.]|nr:MAG: putative capsid assembly protease C [Prokaryotic dsDNA virus sp.]|tara:strand:+ start:1535 stop:2140 length:606 start_codon:yes stop_codon:yes gene_type:complete